MGDPSQLFGSGGGLSALLGLGGTAPNLGATSGGLAIPGSDAASMDFSQLFDPTGSTTATDAITGNTAGITPAGVPDVGGQLSSPPATTQMGPEGPIPPPPQAPAQPVPAPQAAAAVGTGPFSPAQQPTVPGPTGWQQQPSGGGQLPAWARSKMEAVAGNRMQLPSYTGDVAGWPNYSQPAPAPADTSTDPTSQDDPTRAPAQTSPPAQGGEPTTPPPRTQQTGAAGQGGFPGAGGIGNLVRDIMGVMSGNPMSLMNLVRDLGGAGGMPGGMPGMPPGMGGQQGTQAAPWLAQGQPAPPGTDPRNFPLATPGMRFVPGQGLFDAQGNRVGDGQPGSPTSGIPPRPRPPGAAGVPPTRVTTQPVGASGQPTTPLPSGGVEAGTRRPLSSNVSAPPAAGPVAATPLRTSEVSVPDYSVGARGGPPPMRPSQPSVDRSQFRNENNDETAFRAAWMVNGEVGLGGSTRQQIVQLETAFNRAQQDRIPLSRALLDSRQRGDDGYYDGISPHPTYAARNRPTLEQFIAFKQNVWNPVMQGSNLSDIGWGPMTGNASGGLAVRGMGKMQGYLMGGESYFRERTEGKPPFPTVSNLNV